MLPGVSRHCIRFTRVVSLATKEKGGKGMRLASSKPIIARWVEANAASEFKPAYRPKN